MIEMFVINDLSCPQHTGTHLRGGIHDDQSWQYMWTKIVGIPSRQVDVPKGNIGRRFVEVLACELDGIRTRKWNSEKLLVYQVVVL